MTSNGQVIKVLVIDGQNSYDAWPKNTYMMKDYLEQTRLFSVDVERTAITWQGPGFHSTLGHNDASMECVGFIVTFQRGTEWAASGNVPQVFPEDFPTKDKVSVRPWKMK